MVQEVQTPVTPTTINTLETIEAIWTSSRKIIIWRQTRDRPYGESWASMSLTIEARRVYPGEYYEDMEWTVSVYDVVWELAYTQVWNWLRVPLEWMYSITINCARGSTTQGLNSTTTTRIKVDTKTVYTYTTSVYNPVNTETISVLIWKFSVISIHIDMERFTEWTWWWDASVIVKKL